MLCLAAFLLTALAAAGATRPPPESAASCPYDLSTAARMIPPECFANATAGQAATGCCWYVLAAYIFAAADHANRTGEAFLPRAPAAACSGAFAAALVSGGLVSRSLLAAGTDGSCDLTGDRLAALPARRRQGCARAAERDAALRGVAGAGVPGVPRHGDRGHVRDAGDRAHQGVRALRDGGHRGRLVARAAAAGAVPRLRALHAPGARERQQPRHQQPRAFAATADYGHRAASSSF
jgi:hypothetical protein